MEAALVGQVLGSRERDTWRDNALNRGVIGKVEEKHGSFQRAVLLEILLEKVSCFHVNSHGGEHYGELVTGGTALCSVRMASLRGLSTLASVNQAGLSANLCRNVIVGKTCGWDARVNLSENLQRP